MAFGSEDLVVLPPSSGGVSTSRVCHSPSSESRPHPVLRHAGSAACARSLDAYGRVVHDHLALKDNTVWLAGEDQDRHELHSRFAGCSSLCRSTLAPSVWAKCTGRATGNWKRYRWLDS